MSQPTLQWGILGTGSIAKKFATHLASSTTGKIVAVGSRSAESAETFGAEFNLPKRHGSYEALLADPEVHAVYIAVPHPLHAEWAVKAARARKHLLVEKPVALNFAETMVMTEAALDNDVFLMEAFMYRCHPQTARLVELVKARTIGEIKLISADFSFHWPRPWNAESRLTSNELGGGGILDVGCYAVSMCRLLAGAAVGKPFVEPEEVKGQALIGKTGVDEVATALMRFPGGVLAELSCAVQLSRESELTLYGTDGKIVVPKPWVPGASEKVFVHRNGKDVEEIVIECPTPLYTLEADVVAKYLPQRQSPTMSWEDSLGNMRTLDRWREAVGQQYASEGLEAIKPIPPRKLARQPQAAMKYGTIPGIEKKVARLMVGADFAGAAPRDAYAIFDAYYEQGGNAFDSGYIYSGGKSDEVLGAWMRTRGVREECVVLAKGAHSPFCTPADADSQLTTSLERMKLPSADLYAFHRDNLKVPVGEFVDVASGWVSAGKIKAWGGSNWTIQRTQEAIDYAARRNLHPPKLLSNQFSLARMVEPIWGGCISASDPEARAWLTKTQVALIPWSSQARGFFVDGMAHPDHRGNAELVKTFYADDNFKRLERVKDMAAKRNVLPINIALAYVLNQPFPCFPLIGPRLIRELRTSLPALMIELSPDELKWLNLES